MKVETQDLEDRQVQLTVEVPEDRVQAAMRKAARRLSKNTRIPGFRPGKAPYEVVVRVLGQETVFEEALDDLGPEVYWNALEQTQLEPYAPGTLDEVISEKPLVLRYIVPLAPEVDLGDYRSLRVPWEEPEVSDEALEEVLENLRQGQALIEPADRPAQRSDVVVVDVEGELLEPEEDENPLLVRQEGIPLLLEEDTDWPVPGITDRLKGIAVGEERTFEYTFPEDYPSEDLRGRRARFKVVCHEIKSRLVPEWSDDLARAIGDYEDLLDLRLKVRQELQETARRQAEEAYAEKVLEALVDQAAVRYPPVLLEEEIHELLHDLDQHLRARNLTLEDYLRIEGKTASELREELRPQAERRLARALVLGRLVEVEDLEVSDEEVEAEIERMVGPLGPQGEELRRFFQQPTARKRIALDLLTKKAVDRLVAIARGEVEEAPSAEAQPEPAVSAAEEAPAAEREEEKE